MIQHIATTKRRLAAETGSGQGGQQAGPTQNDVEQGQCFADVVGGVTESMMDNFAGFAGAVAGSLAGGSIGGAVGAATAGFINASSAALDAAASSEACQNLDNASLANELGIGGMLAP
jgi:hypothetical protein